jgi:hypothetical protein
VRSAWAALQAVRNQARRISEDENMKRANTYAVFGMTNTDSGLETLHFFSKKGKSEVVLDPEKVIKSLGLREPRDIFTISGARETITDETVVEHIGKRAPERLFENDARVFNDRRYGNAMEYFLLKAAKKAAHGENGDTLNPALVETITKILDTVQDPPIPEAMKTGILYQVIWNISHGLYKKNKLAGLDDTSREQQLYHSEKLIACGTGFELLDRGSALLVSTNEGTSMQDNLEIAFHVIKHVRETTRREQLGRHPPLVHINIELNEPIGSPARIVNVKARLRTLADILKEANRGQPEQYRLLTTYSYTGASNAYADVKKRLFPVRVGATDPDGNSIESCPVDILANIPADASSVDDLAPDMKKKFEQDVLANENAYLATFAAEKYMSGLLHRHES